MHEQSRLTADGFTCRGCSSPDTELVLDLGGVPASDHFPMLDDPVEDPRWPLNLFMCRRCLLVQLGPKEFPEPEPPRAVESATSLSHAESSAGEVVAVEGLHVGATVIEIDSHHGGSWMSGFTTVGLVERGPDEQADLVADVHGIAHEQDLAGPLAAHARRLLPGGKLVLEFHHLLALVEQSQIDTIRHGHWVYFSLLSMQRLLHDHGLLVTRALRSPVFGGSLRLTAQRMIDDPVIDVSVAELVEAETKAGLDDAAAFRVFGVKGREVAASFRSHLVELREAGRSVAGYGAPSKAPVLVALADVDESLLPFTVDLSPAKHDRRIPGTHIPIKAPATLVAERPDEVVILTWDIAPEIIAQLRTAAAGSGWEPAFYVPLPEAGYLA